MQNLLEGFSLGMSWDPQEELESVAGEKDIWNRGLQWEWDPMGQILVGMVCFSFALDGSGLSKKWKNLQVVASKNDGVNN